MNEMTDLKASIALLSKQQLEPGTVVLVTVGGIDRIITPSEREKMMAQIVENTKKGLPDGVEVIVMDDRTYIEVVPNSASLIVLKMKVFDSLSTSRVQEVVERIKKVAPAGMKVLVVDDRTKVEVAPLKAGDTIFVSYDGSVFDEAGEERFVGRLRQELGARLPDDVKVVIVDQRAVMEIQKKD